jgi:hypothetical protein
MKVGDIVKFKKRFHESGTYAIILEVYVSSADGDGGWISIDYVVMTNKGVHCRIAESVVDHVYSNV